jgi:hypothetical protein
MTQEPMNSGMDAATEDNMSAEYHEYQPTGMDVRDMNPREIAMETLYWLRQAGSALVQLQQGGMGGMMKMMMGQKTTGQKK